MSDGGKSGGGGMPTYDYFGSIAAAVCVGPVDQLVAITIDGKEVWTGPISRPPGQNAFIDVIEGFGAFTFYWGGDNQVLEGDSVLRASVNDAGEDHPPYRGVAFIELRDFLFGREKTSAPNIEVVVRRTPVQSIVTGSAAVAVDNQVNPACVLAELLTSPRHGLGLPVSMFDLPSWQETANALEAKADVSYISPLLNQQKSVREVCADLALMSGVFLAYNETLGKVQLGYSPQAFPWTDPLTLTTYTSTDDLPLITADDLLDAPRTTPGDWGSADNEWTVIFPDRDRAYKDSSERYSDLALLAQLREVRAQTLRRPHITRRDQARRYAAEYARRNAVPGLKASLTVRASKGAALRPGMLVRLDIDPEPGGSQLRQVVQVVERSTAATGDVTLRVEADTSHIPVPWNPDMPSGPSGELPQPAALSALRFVEPPPRMAGGVNYGLIALAQRGDNLTVGFSLLYDSALDGTFPKIGDQRNFSVKLGLASDLAADATSILCSTASAHTRDLENIDDDVGETAARDDVLLAFLVKVAGDGQIAEDADGFPLVEVCSVASVTTPGANQRALTVLRGRFNTPERAFQVATTEVWLVLRKSLGIHTHADFEAAAASQDSCYFKAVPFNLFTTRDVSSDTPTEFVFPTSRLFAPRIAFTASPGSGSLGLPFVVSGYIEDKDHDLTGWTLLTRHIATGAEVIHQSGAAAVDLVDDRFAFSVPVTLTTSGNHLVIVRATDARSTGDGFVEDSFQVNIPSMGVPPMPPSALGTRTGYNAIWLDWTNATLDVENNPASITHTEIWVSKTINDRRVAEKVGESFGTFWSYATTTSITHYFWVRHRGTNGTLSAFHPADTAGVARAAVTTQGDSQFPTDLDDVPLAATPPVGTWTTDDYYYDTELHGLYRWDGAAWAEYSSTVVQNILRQAESDGAFDGKTHIGTAVLVAHTALIGRAVINKAEITDLEAAVGKVVTLDFTALASAVGSLSYSIKKELFKNGRFQITGGWQIIISGWKYPVIVNSEYALKVIDSYCSNSVFSNFPAANDTIAEGGSLLLVANANAIDGTNPVQVRLTLERTSYGAHAT